MVNTIRNKLLVSFPDMMFNAELHKYTYQDIVLTPVSTFIRDYHEEFDAEGQSKRSAKKHNLTPEYFLEKWQKIGDDARDKGHETHDFGENYVRRVYFKEDIQEEYPKNKIETNVVRFWENLPKYIVPVAVELRMYLIKYGLAGTTDIVLYNLNTKKLIIADYKTNENLFKNFMGKRMYKPFHHFLDMPYNHYTIQLSQYQIMLEEVGFEIEDRFLIHLTDDDYKLYRTKDCTTTIKNIYAA